MVWVEVGRLGKMCMGDTDGASRQERRGKLGWFVGVVGVSCGGGAVLFKRRVLVLCGSFVVVAVVVLVVMSVGGVGGGVWAFSFSLLVSA